MEERRSRGVAEEEGSQRQGHLADDLVICAAFEVEDGVQLLSWEYAGHDHVVPLILGPVKALKC